MATKPGRRTAKPAPAAVLGVAFGIAVSTSAASENDRGRSGRQVYEQTCSACHATGVGEAPRWGDRSAWKPLIEEGQEVLTAHAWVGVRGMPARGGDPTLSLAEFARAVAYMARGAGGDWQDPEEAMLGEIREEEARRVEKMRADAKSDD